MQEAASGKRVLPRFEAAILMFKFLFQPAWAALVLFAGCATSPSLCPAHSDCCPRSTAMISTTESGNSICDMDAQWETDAGKKIRLRDLNGRVRLISMFYATCQGVCVITRQDMQEIEASLSPKARDHVDFVLVTLDASRDTAQALRAYRRTEGLSPVRWTLLRGDASATEKLAALLGISAGRDASGRFVHSSELIVLDESGHIIQRHGGLRADLQGIARELEAATQLETPSSACQTSAAERMMSATVVP